jgi:hypothetical protein
MLVMLRCDTRLKANARSFGYSLLAALTLAWGLGALNGSMSAKAVTDPCPCTLFPSTATPATANWPDANSVELGVKFTADSPGYVDGVKFFKGDRNTGTHFGSLWTAGGQLLATGTFAGESASGWQALSFSTPVAVQANTVYVASYHTNTGFYSADPAYFSHPVDAGPLHALAGVNGVFAYGASQFPNQTFNQTNYWVDVTFDLSLTTTTLASSANPSVFGQPVTLTATVAPVRPAAVAPTGTVTFYDGSQQLGVAALDGRSPDRATLSTAALTAGDHALSAVYGGSSAFVGSTSAGLTQHVQRVPTSLSAAPAVLGLDPLHLSLLNLSAKLTRSDNGAPLTGQTIQFSSGAAALCSATTDGGGVATCNGAGGVLSIVLNGGYTAAFAGTATLAPVSAHGAAVTV